MKKIYNFLSAILVFALFCVCFAGCSMDTTTASAEELSYIALRINPEIELVVDKDGTVVAVNAINEDGETVLSDIDLIGMTAEEAGETFAARAMELGFIDVETENATVYILIEGKDEEFIKEHEDKMTKKINDFFDKKGVFGKASPEKLEEYETLAEELGVSLKEARIISRITELYPEMTVEEILALTFEERMELLKDDSVKNGFPADLREEYRQAVEALKEDYSALFDLRKELAELELQLTDTTLSEEELAVIQQEYDEKKAEFETLKAQYKEAVEQLKTERRENAEAVREEIKERAHDRQAEFDEKIKQHEEYFRENKEEIGNQIREWRDNHR